MLGGYFGTNAKCEPSLRKCYFSKKMWNSQRKNSKKIIKKSLTKIKSLYIINIQKKQKRRKNGKNNERKPWGCKRERERERERATL